MKSASATAIHPVPSPRLAPPKRWRWLHRAATLLLILVALFWIAILFLAALLKWYVVPNIDSLRPQLETYISTQAQRPIQIERIVALPSEGSLGWLPSFDIIGLRVLAVNAAPDSSAQLSFGRVNVHVTPLSLLQRKIDQLRIESPRLQVRRSTLGTWFVAGFELTPGNKPSPALDWLFSQGEILMTQGQLDFTDELLGQPSVRLSNAQLLLRNGIRSHHLRLDATPPAAWGQSLQIQGQFRQPLLGKNPGYWQNWTGRAYAKVARVTPQGFQAYLPQQARDYAAVLSGTQSVSAWAQLQQGKLVTADLVATAIPNIATSVKLRIEGLDQQAPRLRLSGDVKLANADVAADIQAQWQQTEHPLGHLDLKAQVQRFDLTTLHRYLGQVPALQGSKTVQYLQAAFERGTAKDVSVRLKGALGDFPFEGKKSGEFKVSGQLLDTQFNFAPNSAWPGLQQSRAQFELDHLALSLSRIEAQWAGLALKGSIKIANLRAPVVVIQAEAKAPVQDWIRLTQTTPIQAATGALLAQARGTGLMNGHVQITVPAAAPAQTKVIGTLTLQDDKPRAASLLLHPSAPLLSDLKGSVTLTESSFALSSITGKALGGEFKLASAPVGTAPTGTLLASGTASVEALSQWQGLAKQSPWLMPVLAQLQGQTAFGARFTPSTDNAYSLVLESNLVGLQSKLPEPLTKTAAAAWPLRLEHSTGTSPVQRTHLRVADLLDADLQQDTAASAVRGNVRAGKEAQNQSQSPAPLPERGIAAQLQLAAFDVDAWQKLALLPASVPTSTAPSISLPVQISAALGQLTIAGRRFDQVVLGASQQGGAWRVNAKSVDLDGYFEYRTGQLTAKLAHLTIPDNQSKSQLENLLQDSPSSLPALDIVVDAFELANKRLGRLEIQAVNQRATSNLGTRPAIEWRLQKLWLTHPDAAFKGTGVWDNKRVDLQFALDVNDSGALLTRLGLPGTIQDGKGSVQGRVGWLGSPLALHYPSLAGQLKLDFAKGQFLKVDPGAGRLLSVLSLQALPRLLKLDFRDVFSDGFAFDSFGGDAQIKDGTITTQNLQMKSVLALVSISGQADLAKETQDLRVLVLPDVNAGGASLLATIINPVVGAVSYLAQLVLRRPLVAAATKEYAIAGTWQNPRVSQIAKP